MASQVNGNGGTPVPPGSFHEAPASVNTFVVSPAGYTYQLTMRAGKVADVLSQAATLEQWLAAHDWKPAPTRQTTATQASQNAAPLCPEHQKPMRQGKHGFYCPAQVGIHPQTGKPLYCQHKS